MHYLLTHFLLIHKRCQFPKPFLLTHIV